MAENATDDDQQVPKLPKGRTLREFGLLSPAEKKLLACAADGTVAILDDERPTEATDGNTVRAAFVRFLALGGDNDAPVHEHGVQLWGAWIEGKLDFEGAKSKGGLCLFTSTFVQRPEFRDSHITGELNLSGTRTPGLSADRLTCDAPLTLRKGFLTTGEVRLMGATVAGDFAFQGGSFQNAGGTAISADGVNVSGDVSLDDGFTAQGEVRFLDATISSSFSCRGGSFQNGGAHAISADRVKVGGNVNLDVGFAAQGAVRFLNATVGGNFSCRGGSFQNAGQCALSADGMSVGSDVYLDEGFTAQGEIRFVGANIGDSFECGRGSFQNSGMNALSADRMKVGGTVHLNAGFTAQGAVRLAGATVGRDLSCRSGSFENAHGSSLELEMTRVGGTFFFDQVHACSSAVNLTGGSVHNLVDDAASWPDAVVLDGFRYETLAGSSPVAAKSRLAWLDKQPADESGKNGKRERFRPQPWLQLRNVLRTMGHYEEAREIGIAFEKRKRHCGLIGQTSETASWWCPTVLWPMPRFLYRTAANLLHRGYGGLVDYGYRPLRLLLIATLVWTVCAVGFFFVARYDNVFVPKETAIYQKKYEAVCGPPDHVRWTDCKAIQEEYPLFYPAVYSLNVLLPVGNLGQEAAWRPITTTWSGLMTQLAVWFETLFGWVASLILIAVVSGLAKRDE